MVNQKYPFIKLTKEITELLDKLQQRQFTIKSSELSYRTLGHYYKTGILEDIRNSKQKWRKFNYIEIIWIRIIKDLRKFGISLDFIRALRFRIFIEESGGFLDRAEIINKPFELEIALALLGKYELFLIIFSDGSFTFQDSNSTEYWTFKEYRDITSIIIPLRYSIKNLNTLK